ncbi:hypothetical protein GYMLUDRAFT_64775 [Collybiopsis luxurians FD-317 M1]|uniref:Uncharacterized protein n=1 Tax=Collybiopsis luxurians FD-317 M1 TaxID=944289 RepID=A0A0D0C1G4_9AGAR|nr:hypothetical protein GYMLUDRAFT_64775 [Collybiopsis luxurians FD-317 M1]
MLMCCACILGPMQVKAGTVQEAPVMEVEEVGSISDKEIRLWEHESHGYSDNCIQWFHAEADFEHWQEQLEQKHVEFLLLAASFAALRDVWKVLASDQYSAMEAHVVYAKEHSDMYETLCVDVESKYECCGIPFLCKLLPEETIADKVLLWQQEEEKHFAFDQYVSLQM